MLEQLIPIFVGRDSRLRELGEGILKFILTSIMAIGSWKTMYQPAFDLKSANVQSLIQFIFTSPFLLLCAFFIFYWYLFYSILPLFIYGYFLRMMARLFSPASSNRASQTKAPKPPSKFGLAVLGIFIKFGILSKTDQTISLGPLLPLLMSRIKKTFASEKLESLNSEFTSPFVTFQFMIVYYGFICPSLSVPLFWTILFTLFAILLLVSGLVTELIVRLLRLLGDQLIQILEAQTQPDKVGQPIGRVGGQP